MQKSNTSNRASKQEKPTRRKRINIFRRIGMSHWYDKDGKPQHFIEKADGTGKRASTLRDARKFLWFPSVTGVLDTIDKPVLNMWFQSQILMAALTLPQIENEPLDKFSERIKVDAFKESNEAKDTGTEIHDDMEIVFKEKGFLAVLKHTKIAHTAVRAIIDYCGTTDLIPEVTVAGEGYGGKVDLYNDTFLIDYKTKDIKDKQWDDYQAGKNPKIAYPEMAMQLSAYDKALGWHEHGPYVEQKGKNLSRKCINVFNCYNFCVHNYTYLFMV